MNDPYSELRIASSKLAEARHLLSRAAEALYAAWDEHMDAYENAEGETIFFGDLIDDINDALDSDG